jgi:hypothetical protein
MLGAAFCMLVVVSAFIAFGSWPGETSAKQVDRVLLNELSAKSKPKAVAVRSDAVKVARAQRRQSAGAGTTTRGGRTPAAKNVAKAPAGGVAPTTVSGGQVAAAPVAATPVGTVKQQAQKLTDATKPVTNQVKDTVDKTTTQVNEVVDQVVGGVQQQAAPTVDQVKTTVDTTTGVVGGLLGH